MIVKAQQQLAQRWASEDVVSVLVMEQSEPGPKVNQQKVNGLGVTACPTDYYQSPPSTTETESSGSVMVEHQQRRGIINDVPNGGPAENAGRYPEYKH